MGKMKTEWKSGDIIDFEYFRRLDQDMDETALDRRDREIFLHNIAPKIPSGHGFSPRDSRFLVKEWLNIRRSRDDLLGDDDIMLPGEAYTDFVRSLKVLLLAVGLASGAILAMSLLQYTGEEPINVSIFLGSLILPQFFLVSWMLVSLCLRSMGFFNLALSPLYGWIARYLARGMAKLKTSGDGKVLTGTRRQSMEAILDLARMKKKVYGRVFFWPLFLAAQMFGIGFNLGALVGTVLQVMGKDLAFGWQTTLETAPSLIFRLISNLAVPWKWFMPSGLAHPTFDQVAGSRMILKDGIYDLSTPDLVSWWPFLFFCLVFYGLIPRALFYAWGTFMEKVRLRQLTFSHADGLQLVTRLITPLVASSGSAFKGDVLPSSLQWKTTMQPPHDQSKAMSPRFTALIPEDIFDACKKEDLVEHFARILGFRTGVCLKVTMDMDLDGAMLKSEITDEPESGTGIIFVLLEAWQPPIKEVVTYLEDLRVMFGKTAPLYIGLVGKPRSGKLFSPVEEADWKLWSRKTTALNDPFIILEKVR